MNDTDLHRQSIVIDATCPVLKMRSVLEDYRRGGATAVAPTIGLSQGALGALEDLGDWHRLIRNDRSLTLIRRASDIDAAKRDGKLGIIFHFQGGDAIEKELNYIDAYKALGVGMIQLTYNVKNRIGDGCEERTDAGLSKFGLAVIKRMNEARIVVDVSHTGYRTTMEAIEASERPVVFSHAAVRAIHESLRNVSDEQIKAVAATGGLVGVAGCAFFVSPAKKASMDAFISHIQHIVDLVGPQHVGLGLDYWDGQHPFCTDEESIALYDSFVRAGHWTPETYPRPPYYHPEGLESPEQLPNLTRALLDRGFSESDVRKIMGENWVRVLREVWGE